MLLDLETPHVFRDRAFRRCSDPVDMTRESAEQLKVLVGIGAGRKQVAVGASWLCGLPGSSFTLCFLVPRPSSFLLLCPSGMPFYLGASSLQTETSEAGSLSKPFFL